MNGTHEPSPNSESHSFDSDHIELARAALARARASAPDIDDEPTNPVINVYTGSSEARKNSIKPAATPRALLVQVLGFIVAMLAAAAAAYISQHMPK